MNASDAGHQRKRVRSDRAGCKVGLKQVCARGYRTTMRYRSPHHRCSPRRDGSANRSGCWCRLLPRELPYSSATSVRRKIDTAMCDDRSARDRAAPMESPDGLACRDRPAVPGRARHTAGERGHTCRSRSRRENCRNRTGRPAGWSRVREPGPTSGLRRGRQSVARWSRRRAGRNCGRSPAGSEPVRSLRAGARRQDGICENQTALHQPCPGAPNGMPAALIGK